MQPPAWSSQTRVHTRGDRRGVFDVLPRRGPFASWLSPTAPLGELLRRSDGRVAADADKAHARTRTSSSFEIHPRDGTMTVAIRSGTKVKTDAIRGSTSFKGFGSRNRIDEVIISSSTRFSATQLMDKFIVGCSDAP